MANPNTSPRVFRSSLSSRRFPALRSLTAEDVEVMVMPQPSSPKKSTKPPASATKAAATASSAVKAPAAGKGRDRAAPKTRDRPPFRPCNPVEARNAITQERHGYVGLHSPYDLAHRLEMLERQEAQKHVIGGVFVPNAPAKAKEAVKVNYYLNSPDAETIEAERRFIQDKARRNMLEYYRRAHGAQVKQQSSPDS